LDQRAAAAKRATLMRLVTRVDQILLLTTDQRTKLAAVLERHWDTSWDHPEWATYVGSEWPPMPDEQIYPLLTETQATTWRTLPARTIRLGFGTGMMPEIKVPDEVWDDDRLPKAPPAAGGKAADKDKGLPKVGGTR
jgi:hypothetical protein